jgi:8-oxo-dGTP pyrophosphatase MutT (NUDIX family)
MRHPDEMSETESQQRIDADEVSALLDHPAFAKLKSVLASHAPATAEDVEGVRRAAVALIFRAGDSGSPELLFIKRADYPGDPWSGQVAFPGGREEAGDPSLSYTAIRETREEIGLDLEHEATLIGTLDDLRPQTVRLPAISVRPHVFLLGEPASLTLSDEVARAFWIPLELLQNGDLWKETSVLARGIQMNRRAFHHEGQVIWGMTERILAQLLALIE